MAQKQLELGGSNLLAKPYREVIENQTKQTGQ